jgi:ubiquinone/menaquinone biosynthesis C-methylase UbiE
MFPTFGSRSVERELIDGVDYTAAELLASLSDLRRINRFLGGRRALFKHLLPMIDSLGQSRIRLLDLGTGSADIPIALVKWARRRGLELEFVVLDNNWLAVEEARRATLSFAEVSIVQADALAPPFRDASFDFVLCSLFLHHFRTDEAARLLTVYSRIARHAVIINDLHRHWFAYYSIKALTALFASRLVRNDAALSVLRGFTRRDVDEIAKLAGQHLEIFQHFPYRFALIADVALEPRKALAAS